MLFFLPRFPLPRFRRPHTVFHEKWTTNKWHEILTDFQYSFTAGKTVKFSITYDTSKHILSVLLLYLGKCKSSNLLQITLFTRHNLKLYHIWQKHETFLVIWLNRYWYWHNSCSKCTSFVRTLLKDSHTTCQWCCGPCHSKRAANAASVRRRYTPRLMDSLSGDILYF